MLSGRSAVVPSRKTNLRPALPSGLARHGREWERMPSKTGSVMRPVTG